MSTIPCKRIRIAADAATLDAPSDLLTGLVPAFYRGNDLRVEFALLMNGVLQNTTNIASVTLEIKPSDDDATPPDAATTPLMTKTIASASLNNSLSQTNWTAGTDQHGVISFTAAESNIAAGPMWMSLWMMTNDNPGKVVTLCAGRLMVREDGSSGSVQTPPIPVNNYYTSTQSDARYLQGAQNLSDLASASAARLNLGLGSAAVLNTGTSSGNVPVLNSSGKLDNTIIPTIDTSTLNPRGGVMLNGGWMTIPSLVIGKSDFDFVFLVKRENWSAEQYLLGGASGALSLRFTSGNTLRAAVAQVGDVLESSSILLTDANTWVRLKRSGGVMQMYFNDTLVGSVSDAINYSGAITALGAQDTSGTSSFKGTIVVAAAWNRGLDDGSYAEYKALGGPDLGDRWGSLTNIYNASSLTIGKRVYLKTNGSETITINGQVYKDGTAGSIDARNGVEIVVASATISGNTLTSASTLRTAGMLWNLDCAVGCGYMVFDKSANNAHALLSENGWEHAQKIRTWQLMTTLSAGGYIGGSARMILPPGHIITGLNTIGGSGITISAGETSGGTTLVSSLACNATVANATLVGYRTSNQYLYINYSSGSGTVTVLLRGVVV